MRDRVWKSLCNLKYKEYLIDLLIQKFQNLDRWINIFLAIASSGSIATWVIWREYSLLWGGIIAVSQVVQVIKPYFPFNRYVKELNSKNLQISSLNLELERLWYKIQHKKITEDQVSDIYYDLRKKMNEVLHFEDDTVFNVSGDLQQAADKKMKVFLEVNYGIKIKFNY